MQLDQHNSKWQHPQAHRSMCCCRAAWQQPACAGE
jgi:hypothetical protein